ncbi:Germin-like protein subfamily 3 member 2 [Capsicum chinense]|nr:Germin-like protein subfamily 3 member 2 [Capsicum chinense]
MREHLNEMFKLNVSYSIMKRVKKLILEKLEGSYIDEFNKLEAYAQELRETNPGTNMIINISKEASDQGKRRFIKRRLAKRTYDRGLGIALKAYAELKEFTSIFLSCKHSSLVTVDDFVYSGTKDPGNFKHSGFSSIPVSSTIFPRLNTLGMSFVHADFDVDGVNVPHFHPRATETALVLKGKIYSGFVDSGNRVFAKVNSITKYSLTSSENCASMSFPSSAV